MRMQYSLLFPGHKDDMKITVMRLKKKLMFYVINKSPLFWYCLQVGEKYSAYILYIIINKYGEIVRTYISGAQERHIVFVEHTYMVECSAKWERSICFHS